MWNFTDAGVLGTSGSGRSVGIAGMLSPPPPHLDLAKLSQSPEYRPVDVVCMEAAERVHLNEAWPTDDLVFHDRVLHFPEALDIQLHVVDGATGPPVNSAPNPLPLSSAGLCLPPNGVLTANSGITGGDPASSGVCIGKMMEAMLDMLDLGPAPGP